MDIIDIKREKHLLEQDIYKMVCEFYEKTGVGVRSVKMNCDYWYTEFGDSMVIKGVEVDLVII